MSKANSSYKITPVQQGNQVRHLIISRTNHLPSRAAGFYESHLNRSKNSPNTIRNQLQGFSQLLSWGDDVGVDVDERFLSGQPLQPLEIQSFSHWLMEQSVGRKQETLTDKKTHNQKLVTARTIERWFVELHYQNPDHSRRAIEVAQIIETQSGIWKRMMRKTIHKPEVSDLSEDEIREIETFLRGEGVGESATAIGARRYLMWRLALEFGLRIGEILAMRNEDCPSRTSSTFKVVRIEDRNDPPDPRGAIAPRPKTLGRELGIMFTNSAFPHLVSTFQSEHRHGWKISRKGKRIKDWNLPHPYLITDTKGEPLSMRAASKDASVIAEATGIDFTWHKVRHAFFNRAYASVADIEDINKHNARLMDLVYWGGWNDPGSLNIYSRRARKERARDGFTFWKEGGAQWSILD
mgnify:CR=1 FL=1